MPSGAEADHAKNCHLWRGENFKLGVGKTNFTVSVQRGKSLQIKVSNVSICFKNPPMALVLPWELKGKVDLLLICLSQHGLTCGSRCLHREAGVSGVKELTQTHPQAGMKILPLLQRALCFVTATR